MSTQTTERGTVAGSLFRTKSIDKLLLDAQVTGEHTLKRTLGAGSLVALGIGAVIGAGIFVRTAAAIAERSGPSVTIAFMIAGLGCAFAGLCYAEFVSIIPIAGSAYTYSYATMGELVAWIIGWDLILEYLVGAATVSVGWSGYVREFVKHLFGVSLPKQWTSAPLLWEHNHFVATGNIVDLPAVLITIFVTIILVIGIRESARFNSVIVAIKLAVVLLFIGAAAKFVRPENWHPFLPE